MSQQTPDNCLCGALPVVEEKADDCLCKLYKYRCPNCAEKELPWLGQWHDCGALQEWNNIAPKKSYRKRTLEFNEHGVCNSEPSTVLEWRDKKYHYVIIKIFEDNGRFYYSYDWGLKNEGGGCGLWVSEPGFPTMELLKVNAKKRLGRIMKNQEGATKILNTLLPEIVQKELF